MGGRLPPGDLLSVWSGPITLSAGLRLVAPQLQPPLNTFGSRSGGRAGARRPTGNAEFNRLQAPMCLLAEDSGVARAGASSQSRTRSRSRTVRRAHPRPPNWPDL